MYVKTVCPAYYTVRLTSWLNKLKIDVICAKDEAPATQVSLVNHRTTLSAEFKTAPEFISRDKANAKRGWVLRRASALQMQARREHGFSATEAWH